MPTYMTGEPAVEHGKKAKAPAKELHHMRVHPAENGGHMVEHHFTHGMYEPEQHVFGESEGSELVAHLVKHGKIKVSKPSKAEEEAEGE